LLRGGSAPSLFLTPLSSQENISFIYNGSGWRGVRGEIKDTNQMQMAQFLSIIETIIIIR